MGEVRTASNLREAFREMRKIPPPDLVVLDLIFCGTEASSADETLKHIAALKAINENTVVLVVTGANEITAQLALQHGADFFVTKEETATQERLYRACQEACRVGGQAMLDTLNEVLTPKLMP